MYFAETLCHFCHQVCSGSIQYSHPNCHCLLPAHIDCWNEWIQQNCECPICHTIIPITQPPQDTTLFRYMIISVLFSYSMIATIIFHHL